ncbi:MAG: Hsp20/alpha crystallin family protein [Candidatus Omnitrophica bacterium]|nr:Hsp20/alpha crystallin family protein [Candidatus Omnitrophota bacterium]
MSIKDIVERKNDEKRALILQPAVNIQELGDHVILQAEMPGLTKEDVTVEVQGDELTISGTRRDDTPKGYTTLLQERVPVQYKRIFGLGNQIDKCAVSANYENGILMLTLKKTAAAQPKKITVS